MTREQVDLFEKFYTQVEALHNEIGALSKKSPNDAVNKFKLKFINNILIKASNLLTEQYKPFDDFDLFEEDDLPTTSDVTILAQYLNCMEKFRSDNIIHDYGRVWCWIIDDEKSEISTAPPKKLKG